MQDKFRKFKLLIKERFKVFNILMSFLIFISFNSYTQPIRSEVSLNSNWTTIADDKSIDAYNGFEKTEYNDRGWKKVNIPHTWDQYEGYRRMRHGNRHGYAWYRKKFTVDESNKDKRYFLFFEGVGSYATIWLNDKQVGYHAGGRTTFTIDVTNSILLNNQPNLISVRADHPSEIRDLPWVCGGCSDERGFSEGSQPMGIFRPVQLIITDPVRVEPFGVHIWNDTTVSAQSANLFLSTEVRNYGSKSKTVTIINRITTKEGDKVGEVINKKEVKPGSTIKLNQELKGIRNPRLWSLEDPYLYKVITEVVEKGKVIDRTTTRYGIRWISWPVGRKSDSKQFLLNGKPVFINGIAEYEHLIGYSHAFSAAQIKSRVFQIKAAGFNAFRDAHQPHNLRYQDNWDSLGILSWTQMAAHVWFDTPEFRNNFKTLLTDWVKERRNSPSVVLWGLENESKLPTDFAEECTKLIRQLDPTASSQRKVTTCNGGSGTDWDVPQNWTGTYGGDPKTYHEDVQRQVLIGEYGAWRTLDLHTEGPFVQNGVVSEDRMTQLMEMKVNLAESVKDKTTGHFFWLFTSHDNPGRVQGGEGLREMDRIGPVNYKGLLTPWEEPLDVFYMFRSNYAPNDKEPMLYIASHTWPDRWTTPGKKDSIIIYSNCDEVELFNDVNSVSLGKKKTGGIGTHFQWDDINIQYNVLYAVGYVNGKQVAKDYIVLNHLPKAPGFEKLVDQNSQILEPKTGVNYLYRVNCGGPEYTDKSGNLWSADIQKTSPNNWGSQSWTNDFPGMPSYFASQRRTYDPISGTADWKLFQTFRFGRDKLKYEFPLPDGEYNVELYFIEPWLGTGGGMDCSGWRLFDVAVNDSVLIKDLDIWKEAGHDTAMKKTVKAKVKGGLLTISFPDVASGQALISAIAISTDNSNIKPSDPSPALIGNLKVIDQKSGSGWKVNSWMDTGEKQYSDDKITFSSLPSDLYGAEWISASRYISSKSASHLAEFSITADAYVYIGIDQKIKETPVWLKDYEKTQSVIETDLSGIYKYNVYRKRYPKGSVIRLEQNKTEGNEPLLMYTVAVTLATSIDPAYDLKTSTNYEATKANLSGSGIIREVINKKESVTFKRSGDILEWSIAVGVADIYALEVRYHNPSSKLSSGKLEIRAADGTLMKEEQVEFTTTRAGKWNYINTTTGTMINAGNYKVRLIPEEVENLSVLGLSVQ